ncbi:MAG: Ni/Fe hydrogenase subunit gamma, partial [Bacteroidota bacterium]
MESIPDIGAVQGSVAADPMLPVLFRTRRVRNETHDTFTLELEPTNGTAGFSFKAGQFNMLYVFGVGEVPISISGNPADHQSLVHTTRAVGAVTRAMRRLKVGDFLGVRGPFGSHWPVEEAAGNDVVIVAGGIGLAPLRSLLYILKDQKDKFNRISLCYGSKTPKDCIYKELFDELRAIDKFQVH